MNQPQVFTLYRLPDGADQAQYSSVAAPGRVRFDSQGKPVGIPFQEFLEQFHLLPAAAAAATAAPYLLTLGVGTEVPSRAVKGGVKLKTQATTPADDDNAMLIPATTGPGAASTAMSSVINAASQPRFESRVMLTTITAVFACFGFSELVTDPNPTTDAGEGAMFVFDPTGEFASAVANYTTNWLIANKVNGADTFADTGIPCLAGVDYEFVIQIGQDFKARFYINGTLVGTGPALTDGDSVAAFLGVEATTTGATSARDFEARYVSVSRLVG